MFFFSWLPPKKGKEGGGALAEKGKKGEELRDSDYSVPLFWNCDWNVQEKEKAAHAGLHRATDIEHPGGGERKKKKKGKREEKGEGIFTKLNVREKGEGGGGGRLQEKGEGSTAARFHLSFQLVKHDFAEGVRERGRGVL